MRTTAIDENSRCIFSKTVFVRQKKNKRSGDEYEITKIREFSYFHMEIL